MVRFNQSMDLPRFIFGENIDGKRQFVIHTQEPRFIGEIFGNDEGGSDIDNVMFIDQPDIHKNTAKDLAKLMSETGDALFEYDRNLDQFEEKEFDDEI